MQGADSLTLSRWGEKQIASCFTPALNQVPAELEGREAEVAGLSNEQRTHPSRAGHRLPAPISLQHPGRQEGACVCPQEQDGLRMEKEGV